MPDGLRVRYRIDGVLHFYHLTSRFEPPGGCRPSKSSKMDISENRRPQDGRIGENMRLVNTQNWEWT